MIVESLRKLGDSDVAEIIMGQSPPSEVYNSNGKGLPFFQGKADFGFIFPSVKQWCSAPIRVAKKNDILISVRAPVGDVNLCREECCIGRGLVAIRCNRLSFYWFLFFYLLENRKLLESFGTGTTFKSINKEAISEFQIWLPHLAEQHKIAAILFKIQEAIETQESIIEKAREVKKSTLHHVFTHGLRGEKLKETEIGLMPESWFIQKIGDLGKIVTGTTPPTKYKGYYQGGHYQFIAPNDIGKTTRIYETEKKITDKGLEVSRLLPKESVCFVCIGSTIGKVGITAEEKSTTNQQINSVIVSNNYDPYFVTYLMDYKSKYIASFASPSPVPILSKGKFEEISIMLSSDITEQQETARVLMTIDETIEIHKAKKSALQDLFKTMLNKLMTGEIRVKDLDIDISEVGG
jgi:type I restriction enzyme, S subunit